MTSGIPCVRLSGAFPGTDRIGGLLKSQKIEIGMSTYKWDIVTADITDPMLLGCDFIKAFGCIINFNNNTFVLGKDVIPAVQKKINTGEVIPIHTVSVLRRTVIPPNCVKIISTSSTTSAEHGKGEMVIEPYEDLNGLLIPRMIVNTAEKDIPLMVVNYSNVNATLKHGQTLGSTMEIDSVLDGDLYSNEQEDESRQMYTDASQGLDSSSVRIGCTKLLDSPQQMYTDASCSKMNVPEHLQSLFERSSEELSAEETLRLKQLLVEYADVFASHDLDLGKCADRR